MILYLTIIFVASCTVALFNALFASMGAGIAVLHTALNVVLMALAGFDKRQIEKPNDNTYILKVLRETCYASIMHVISIFACFVVFAFMPYKLSIVLPVVLTNVLLQLLPVIVQRYNRIRLISLYYFNKRHQEREQNEQN